MSALRISVVLSPTATSTQHVQVHARHAEQLGLDGMFVGDHLLAAFPTLESALALATAAAATERISVGFGVMVLALRHAAWAAKQVASLQQLSGNRVILGIGTGGAPNGKAAFDMVGVPWSERGRRTDAALEVLPNLISGTRPGTGLTVGRVTEMPPIWAGGISEAAIRRSVEFGKAWFPSMLTTEQLISGRQRMIALAEEHGRPLPAISVGGAVLLDTKDEPSPPDEFTASLLAYGLSAENAARVPIVGGPGHAAERFNAYLEAGADHLVLGTIAGDWFRQCELIARARELLDG